MERQDIVLDKWAHRVNVDHQAPPVLMERLGLLGPQDQLEGQVLLAQTDP